MRLSRLRSRKRKEWRKINGTSETSGHNHAYQHLYNVSPRRKGGREKEGRIFEEIMAENLPDLWQTWWQIQGIQQGPSRINLKKSTAWQIIIKLLKDKKTESSLQEWKNSSCCMGLHMINRWLIIRSMEVRRQWNEIFKVPVKKKIHQGGKISQKWGKMKTFPDKQKLRIWTAKKKKKITTGNFSVWNERTLNRNSNLHREIKNTSKDNYVDKYKIQYQL